MDDFEFQGGQQERDGCIPLFRTETVLDEEATAQSGAKIYREIPYVEIVIPGNIHERVIRPVEEKDKKRWPNAWRKFSEGGSGDVQEVDGTPLEEWAQITAAQAKTLRSSEIRTVEQLAEVADVNIQNLGMGMMDLRRRAQVYVEHAKGEMSVQKAAANTRKWKKKAEELEKRLQATENRLEELERAANSQATVSGNRGQGQT